ncbi:UNVERIFIED_CONTAM: hypothetical protein Sradi_4890600 [Sesamum radiatum]|uniref:Uncharacterized protein n=1 Tax=Sesamum radiatum TaxID=300843 RepID=A0AAW2MC12_SESRA
MIPNVNVEAVTARGSDHNPLLINLEADKGPRHTQRHKIFKFEAMWTLFEECEDIVKDSWCGEVKGDAGSQILQRTRRVREKLIGWDRERFGHVKRRVRELEEKLEAYAKDPISASDNAKRSALRGELDEFLTREEIMWKQRGKAQWLREGDRNTPYFHARTSARKKKNFITTLRNKESIDENLSFSRRYPADCFNLFP